MENILNSFNIKKKLEHNLLHYLQVLATSTIYIYIYIIKQLGLEGQGYFFLDYNNLHE